MLGADVKKYQDGTFSLKSLLTPVKHPEAQLRVLLPYPKRGLFKGVGILVLQIRYPSNPQCSIIPSPLKCSPKLPKVLLNLIVPLKKIEYGVYGDLLVLYPKPYSIYLRGTINPQPFTHPP